MNGYVLGLRVVATASKLLSKLGDDDVYDTEDNFDKMFDRSWVQVLWKMHSERSA